MKAILAKLTLLSAAVLLMAAGCATKANINRIVSVTATGTQGGLQENPFTGVYELGLKRIQLNGTIVPVVWQTNSSGQISAVVPDVVQRYEVLGRNGVFGNAGITWTVATGSNSVRTLLGGMAPPVNSGWTTNNNVGTQGFEGTNAPVKAGN